LVTHVTMVHLCNFRFPIPWLDKPLGHWMISQEQWLWLCIKDPPWLAWIFILRTTPYFLVLFIMIASRVISQLLKDKQKYNFFPSNVVYLKWAVGSSNGEITLWELSLRERLVSKPFKIWDVSACSLPFQVSYSAIFLVLPHLLLSIWTSVSYNGHYNIMFGHYSWCLKNQNLWNL